MKLTKLRIVNYRCFKNQEIVFDDYSCLVGPNGSGKSTILMVLNVFFRNSQAPSDVLNLDEEDFHDRNTSEPIEITATFGDLSDDAKDDLKACAWRISILDEFPDNSLLTLVPNSAERQKTKNYEQGRVINLDLAG